MLKTSFNFVDFLVTCMFISDTRVYSTTKAMLKQTASLFVTLPAKNRRRVCLRSMLQTAFVVVDFRVVATSSF